jgi:hypothetical protein
MVKKITMTVLLTLLVFGTAQIALGQCDISGTIVATTSVDPVDPAWTYTLTINWDTGSQYALSHMDLLLDTAGGTCTCDDFVEALSWDDPIGYSDGDPSCTVDYTGNLECNGDPSIPGMDGILLKFEPIEGLGCEPGTTGTAVFTFYSDLTPAPVDEDILSMVDKLAGNTCFGTLSGDFPAMACDPVDVDKVEWGGVKSLYR